MGNGRPSVVRPRDLEPPGPPLAPVRPPAASPTTPGPPVDRASLPHAAQPGPAPAPAEAGGTGLAVTRDELAAASGCSVPVLHDLERFGLLQGRTAGSTVVYGDESLRVARLAARFGEHGLEPRHLRSFRQSAERQIGLFAQVVGPLLQRRDTAAHDRAAETVDELVGLAADLQSVLVARLVAEELGAR